MNSATNYAPVSNHEIQKAMKIIFDDLHRNGKIISSEHVENSSRYVIEYESVTYAFTLDRAHKCTSITIL